ncbi:hypothetical protein JOF29_002698 [Kribbella aluminosa]|uniref:Uncharacterized protein n=1 Tax=Kribbella aluminosa TaxID=416017 RepID=A0ABS4UJ31_9ACTN|nr:hypothetical protein [Kribbella aluminosa]MBP2351615.1 hypothetical protein [Kribbella aluminosa]
MTPPTTPVEVQKDLTKQAVHLEQGRNKLMIQIKHTYTEDVNWSHPEYATVRPGGMRTRSRARRRLHLR